MMVSVSTVGLVGSDSLVSRDGFQLMIPVRVGSEFVISWLGLN